MLARMFEEAGTLKSLPKPEQTIYMRLAHVFESNTEYLFMNPEELLENTLAGTKAHWQTFLSFIETQNYIKGQMAFLSNISQRKTFRSLVEMALAGNQQAAKQVQELSGIMNQQDTNRVVVLHKIPRPEQTI